MASDAPKSETEHQSPPDPRTRPRDESQPICTLTTRKQKHSASTGLRHHNDSIEKLIDDLPPSVASATITDTIHKLEHLLDEAFRIAELVDVPHDHRLAHEEIEQGNSQLPWPTKLTPTKGNRYQGGTPSNSPEVAKLRNETSGRSVRFSEDITSARERSDTDHAPSISRTCRGACGARSLQLLSPDPMVEPESPTHVDALPHQHQSLAQCRSWEGRKIRRLEIAAHTASANSRRVRYKKTAEKTDIPEIRLEGIEPKEEASSESTHLLEEETGCAQSCLNHDRHLFPDTKNHGRKGSVRKNNRERRPTYIVDLHGARHVDVPGNSQEIKVHETYHPSSVARDWSNSRKRFAALVACINTACLGLVLGIYSGEVPAIQYVIVDVDRVMILGNVGLYCGLAISTLLFWPLPLLHGRKPYIISALALGLCLQIPQGLTVIAFRDPGIKRYRVFLLLSRAASGFVLGFININTFATLLDVFGASLQSSRTVNEMVTPYDVRRHGGGMGVWLAFWGWCSVGSIALGFAVGAFIIDNSTVDWGF